MPRRSFLLRGATVVALVAWVVAALTAALVAAGGVLGATGATDYRVPGPGIVSFTPTWSVDGSAALTPAGERGDPSEGTTSFRFMRGEHDAEVQPVDVALRGEVVLGARRGWSGLMFSVF